MKTIWCFSISLVLLLTFTHPTTTQHDVCPPWFVPDNTSCTGCSCRSPVAEVKCGINFTLLRFGYCMSYNNSTETTEHVPSPYIARYNTNFTDTVDAFYLRLPGNVSLLNEFMCGPLNREGILCGDCRDGYGTAIYSYTLECSKCWGHGYGWVLYFFLELFPITVMYFLVVIFHIRATSSPLSAFVFMSQVVVYTIRLNVPLHVYIENKVAGFPYVTLQVLLVLCGIWSLDFFRSVIPPFCVSSNIKTVHALTLEYLVGFYPIVLILITWACMKLHDNNFRPVVWLWRPFHKHFVHFRRRWDSTASIINAFTTFLLLSYSKILFVTFTLLYTFHIHYHTQTGEVTQGRCVLYYDATVECHSRQYFIFAAIAGCVLLLFIILPTVLLILYPTRLFRKCISCCGFRRWHALHMFVESFQGQYKDGTNGTFDFRMVSVSFLILRILILVSFLPNIVTVWPSSGLRCALYISVLFFYSIARPYRSNICSNVDMLTLFLLAIMSLTFLYATFHSESKSDPHFALTVTLLLLTFPHLFLIFYITAKKTGIIPHLKRMYEILKRRMRPTGHASQPETNLEAESDTSALPDRLINPEEYEPVLPSTEECTAAESTDGQESVTEGSRMLTPVYTYSAIN